MATCTVGSLSSLGISLLPCPKTSVKALTISLTALGGKQVTVDVCNTHSASLPNMVGINLISVGPLHDDHVHQAIGTIPQKKK
jgi:hypothetical protein